MKPILNFMYSRDTIWGNADDDIQVYTAPWTGPTLSHLNSVELVHWDLDIKSGLQGDYYLLIKTDWDDRFKEMEETNNIAKIKIFIEEEVNDYWIESLSSNYTTLQPDQEIRLTCESRYQGNNAAVLEAPIHYYFSKDSILDATDYTLMGHGGFGHAFLSYESTVYTDQVVLVVRNDMEAGDYYLIAKIVVPAAFPETDVSNNTYFLKVNITGPARHDFYPSNIRFSKSDGLHAGVPMTINAVLNYGGNSYSYVRGEMQLFLSTDALLDSLDKPMSSIQTEYIERSYSTKDVTFDVVVPSVPETGNYYVLAVVDPEKKILETNENNNFVKKAITINHLDVDLIADRLEVDKDSLYSGGMIQPTFYFRNTSNNPYALDGDYSLYLSKDSIVSVVNGDTSRFRVLVQKSYSFFQEQQSSDLITLPQDLEAGDYYIVLVLDHNQVIYETNENNNSAFAKITIKEAPIHDFAIENVQLSADTLMQGQSLSVEFDQVYYGNSTEDLNPSYEVYLSSDSIIDANDTKKCWDGCGSYGYSSANPKQGLLTVFSIPTTLEPGTYYLIVVADYGNRFEETDEENNRVTVPFVVEKFQFDFTIEKIELASQEVAMNNYASLKIYCKRQGFDPLYRNVSVHVRMSKNEIWGDSDDYALCSNPCPQVNFWANDVVLEYQALIPELFGEGTFNILAKIDGNNSLVESNESNNITITTFTIANKVENDFYLSDVVLSKAIVHRNAPLTIQYKHHYEGNSNRYLSDQIGLYVSNDSIWDAADKEIKIDNVPFAESGGDISHPSQQAYRYILIPNWIDLGSQYLILKADNNNQHEETNEENNTYFVPIEVVEETIDLSVGQLELSRQEVQIGGYLGATLVASLSGSTLNQVNFNCQLILSNDSILNDTDVVIWDGKYFALNQNNNQTSLNASGSVPTSIQPGKRFLFVKVDSANQHNETDETNNVICSPIVVLPKPEHDFYISNAELSTSKLVPQNNVKMDVVYFYGGTSIDNVSSYMKLYLSKDSILNKSVDIDLYSEIGFSLNVNQTSVEKSLSFSIPTSVPVGTYYLLLVADGQYQYAETSEKNNIFKLAVQVVEPYYDFSILSATITPDSTQKGGGNQISYQIGIDSNVKSYYSFMSSVYISKDSIWGTDDVLLKTNSVYVQNTNTVSVSNEYLKLPDNFDVGNYYLLIKCDDGNTFVETNEKNNQRAFPLRVVEPATRDFFIKDILVSSTEFQPGSYLTFQFNYQYVGNSYDLLSSKIQMSLSVDTIWGNADDIAIGSSQSIQNSASQPSTISYPSLDIPSTIQPGKYNLLIKADSDDRHHETNETNNVAYFPIEIDAILSDFTIENLKLSNDSVQAGGFMMANYNMTYQGNAINSMYVYRKTVVSVDTIFGNNDDVMLGQSGFGNSFNRSNTTKSYSDKLGFPIDFKPGQYSVLVQADWNNQVNETNEENNILIKPITVLPQAEHDFFLSDLKLSYDTLQSSLSVPFELTCNYVGNSISDVTASIQFFVSGDSIFGNTDDSEAYFYNNSGIVLNRNNKQTIKTGEFSILNSNLVGNKYLFVKIDSNNSIQETDELNNVLKFPIVIEKVVNDLFVSDVAVNPTQIQQEGTAKISFKLKYNGNSKRELAAQYKVLFSKDTIWNENTDIEACSYSCGSFRFSKDQTESEKTNIFTETSALLVGDWYVLVKIDNENAVNELDENNNVAYTKIQVTEKATRDFSISDLQVYKSVFYYNRPMAISYNLVYSGNSYDFLTVKSNCVLSVNEVWGDADDVDLYNTYDVTSKVNQEKKTAKCIMKLVYVSQIPGPGKYNLLVKADVKEQHIETDETNNIATFEIEVLDPEIDLFVKNLSVDVDTVYAGNPFDVSGYFNIVSKTGQSINSECNFYLSTDKQFGNSDDVLIAEKYIYFEASNPYQTLTISMPKGISAGSYFLFAKADVNNQTAETNEGNNAARMPLLVSQNGANDFYIENFTVSKDTLQIYEPFVVGFDIRYVGKSKSMIPCYYAVKLTDDTLSGNWIYGTSAPVNLSKDSTLRHVEVQFNSPGIPNSDLFVQVEADFYKTIEETNEQNNIAVHKIRLTDYPKLDFSLTNLELISDSICSNSLFRMNYDLAYDGVLNSKVQATMLIVLSKNGVLGDSDDVPIQTTSVVIDPAWGTKERHYTYNDRIYFSNVSPGEYRVFIQVLPFFNNEDDVEDNWKSAPIRVVDQTAGDFSISSLNGVSDTVGVSNYLNVEYTIQNKNGLYPFGHQHTQTRLSKDTIWGNDDDCICFVQKSVILSQSNDSAIYEDLIYIPNGTAPGAYYLMLMVDAQYAYNESDEKNNMVFRPIQLAELANEWYIENLKVTPDTIRNTNDMTISGALHGGIDRIELRGLYVQFFISENDQLDDLDDISLNGLSFLNPSIDSLTGAFTFQTPYPPSLSVGSYHLIARIASANNPEMNTSNSIAVAPFTIACKRTLVHEFIDLCGDETYQGWDTEGDFERAFTSKAGCDSIVYTHIRKYEVPAKPTIVLKEGELLSSSTEGNQWYLEQKQLEGAAEPVHTVRAKGNYAVQILDEFGCDSQLSDYLFVDYTSVLQLEAHLIAYPNPTTGLITIAGLPNAETDLTVFDSVGKLVARKRIVGSDSNIDISDLPSGIYFLKFDNPNNPVLKIVKR